MKNNQNGKTIGYDSCYLNFETDISPTLLAEVGVQGRCCGNDLPVQLLQTDYKTTLCAVKSYCTD